MKMLTTVQLTSHCEKCGGDDPMWLPIEMEWDWDGNDGSGLVIVQTGPPYCGFCNPEKNQTSSVSEEIAFFLDAVEVSR